MIMKEKLEQYLDELVLLLKDGGAFALEQLPLFVQEYLTYYAWYHGIWSVTMVFVAIPLLYLVWYHAINTIYEYKHGSIVSNEVEWGIGTFVLGLVVSLPIYLAVHHLLQMLKVLIAPRVYLIESLSSLL